MSDHPDSHGARARLEVGGRELEIFRLDAMAPEVDIRRLPFSLKVLLENVLRHEDGRRVVADHARALAGWDPSAEAGGELPFHPGRVLMQDFTGVPAVVDLAAMRDAAAQLGVDPARINPQIQADLVIDHSVQVDAFATARALERNAELEYERNAERYAFLKWGQEAFDRFRVVPPATGICHQVNLEHLARVVWTEEGPDGPRAYPDTLVGTDSHTTMVNGLGVLGWGVGGIEAEAALLGEPLSMLLPPVVGVRLDGRLREGTTATDLVLHVTERLREQGVVGSFVEFTGPSLPTLPVADRATLGNMSPEFGSTCAIFPVDGQTLRYLELTGRPTALLELVDAYAREQGLYHDPDAPEATYSAVIDVDLRSVVPSVAGPRRPQDRIALADAAASFRGFLTSEQGSRGVRDAVDEAGDESFPASDPAAPVRPGGGAAAVERSPASAGSGARESVAASAGRAVVVRVDRTDTQIADGSVVIAAITSCTNTSNPSVMVAAGLLARNAVQRGLRSQPWVKTSLAPGSTVVTDYLHRSGLDASLDALGFNLVGYGCTTCIGNSGPLAPEISEAVAENDLVVCSVLSGNRNFEGRINPDARANYLASPPLVVAYALAGRMDLDLTGEPLGFDPEGHGVMLADLWPSLEEVDAVVGETVRRQQFVDSYGAVFDGDERWRAIATPEAERYSWPDSTYVRRPPFFEGLAGDPPPVAPITGARVLALLGDSITTDHISPAGRIPRDSPAGRWLIDNGVQPREFNSYGARRGNHEVMVRGTFANIRLRNQLVDREGGWTRHQPSGDEMTVFDAAERYRADGVPLVVLAGADYGTGSSRDWAAKGTLLLGVRAVIAASFERIHRSHLVGMGVLPLQLPEGETWETLKIDGHETVDTPEVDPDGRIARVTFRDRSGREVPLACRIRLDTPAEWRSYRYGGILPALLGELTGS
ncbi:MAG: aconitate hydratase [Solirubrobacterales bacterium]